MTYRSASGLRALISSVRTSTSPVRVLASSLNLLFMERSAVNRMENGKVKVGERASNYVEHAQYAGYLLGNLLSFLSLMMEYGTLMM